jgi:hypothetical protein
MIKLPLRNRQGDTVAEALIDDVDSHLCRHSWCVLSKKGKVTGVVRAARKSSGDKSLVYLHREIMEEPEGCFVDHKDGNVLDCRRSNLRLATHRQNNQNKRVTWGSSKYKGVSWVKKDNVWKTSGRSQGKDYYLGTFTGEIEAAKGYDTWAESEFGEFACLNRELFPEDFV